MMDDILTVSKNTVYNSVRDLRQLVFEVTDACNLRCKYCTYSNLYEGYDKREDSYFSIKKAKNLIDYLANLWNNSHSDSLISPLAVSFYGGEPLMNIKMGSNM